MVAFLRLSLKICAGFVLPAYTLPVAPMGLFYLAGCLKNILREMLQIYLDNLRKMYYYIKC